MADDGGFVFAEAQALVHEQAVVGDGAAHGDGWQAGFLRDLEGGQGLGEVHHALEARELLGVDDEAADGAVVAVGDGRIAAEVFSFLVGLCAALAHAGLEDAHFDAGKSAFHEQEHPVGVLAGVEDARRSGEFDVMLAAQVQPGDVVLQAVVATEARELDAEHNLHAPGADVGFEARALAQVLGFASGCRGVAVVVDADVPALGAGMGGELFALDGEAVGWLSGFFARFSDVDGAGGHSIINAMGFQFFGLVGSPPWWDSSHMYLARIIAPKEF